MICVSCLYTNISSTHPNVPTWLVGDLNLPNIDWANNCTQGSSYHFILCETISYQLCSRTWFFSKFPNRSKNIFITNRSSPLHSCHPIAGISDRETVYIESSVILTHQLCSKSFIWLTWYLLRNYISQFTDIFLSKYCLSTPQLR